MRVEEATVNKGLALLCLKFPEVKARLAQVEQFSLWPDDFKRNKEYNKKHDPEYNRPDVPATTHLLEQIIDKNIDEIKEILDVRYLSEFGLVPGPGTTSYSYNQLKDEWKLRITELKGK